MLSWLLLVTAAALHGQTANTGPWFVDRWAEFDTGVSNTKDGRWRVNDEMLSLDARFGKRYEAEANGLLLIRAGEDLFEVAGAELYLELWGGHPGNTNKRFTVNGRGPYPLPEVGSADHEVTYSYPSAPVRVEHLVRGVNAFQFSVDRGTTFWGHFIVDAARLRLFLKPTHPALQADSVKGFTASLRRVGGTAFELQVPEQFRELIAAVTYEGRYSGYDDDGDTVENGWHGFTLNQKPVNVVGHVTAAPFRADWETSMVPDQAAPVAVRAVVQLRNGLSYRTAPLEFSLERPAGESVRMYVAEGPKPFWSRNNRTITGTFTLPENASKAKRAQLWFKIWDGGTGEIADPLTLNGHPYPVVPENHGPKRGYRSNVIWRVVDVDPKHLQPAKNTLRLLSGTEHHGIEIYRPGPALLLRWEE